MSIDSTARGLAIAAKVTALNAVAPALAAAAAAQGVVDAGASILAAKDTALAASALASTDANRAEAAAASNSTQSDVLDPDVLLGFSDGNGRLLARVYDVSGKPTWELSQLLSVPLPGGYSFTASDVLDPDRQVVYLDADGRDLGYEPVAVTINAQLAAQSAAITALQALSGASGYTTVADVLDPDRAVVVLDADGRLMTLGDDITGLTAAAAAATARMDYTLTAAGVPKIGLVNGERLRRTRMRLALLRRGETVDPETGGVLKLRVAMPGASYEDRSGATWRVVKDLRAICGDGGAGTIRFGTVASGPGSGFVAAESASGAPRYTVATTGTWVGIDPNDAAIAPAPSALITSMTATALASIAVTAQAGVTTQTVVRLLYLPHSGASVRWQKNGGAWTTIDLSAGYSTTLATTFAAGDVLNFEWVSGSVELNALYCENASAGVVVSKLACSGSGLLPHWLVACSTPGFQAQYAVINPDVSFLGVITSTNDIVSGVYPPLATISAALAAFIAAIRTAVPWAQRLGQDVLTTAQALYVKTTGANVVIDYPALQEATRAVAAANDAAFRNMQDDLPLAAPGDTSRYSLYYDYDPGTDSGGHHPSDAGYALYAASISRSLTFTG